MDPQAAIEAGKYKLSALQNTITKSIRKWEELSNHNWRQKNSTAYGIGKSDLPVHDRLLHYQAVRLAGFAAFVVAEIQHFQVISLVQDSGHGRDEHISSLFGSLIAGA